MTSLFDLTAMMGRTCRAAAVMGLAARFRAAAVIGLAARFRAAAVIGLAARFRAVALVGLAAVIGLGGCFSLSRDEPLPQYYVLGNGLQRDDEPSIRDREGATIGLRRLQLASYLETPFVVVRQGAHRITFSEFHRWGEQLGGGINRAIAAGLASTAPVRSVDVAPWPAGERYDYLVQLRVLHFEGIAPAEPLATAGEVRMLATWEIILHRDGSVVDRGTTDFRVGWVLGDYSALVTTLNGALNVLSDDLAASLEQLSSQPAVSGSTF